MMTNRYTKGDEVEDSIYHSHVPLQGHEEVWLPGIPKTLHIVR